jgi:hypothetical protein
MTPRELFDRAVAAIEDGDGDALRVLYAPDAVRLGSLRDQVGRRLEVLEFHEQGDTARYAARVGEQRLYGMLVVRDGLIWREAQAEAAAPAPAAARAAATPVDLEPYVAWEQRPVPDPRTAGAEARMPVLLEIVAAEGPVLAKRAFDLYTRASGGKKTTTAVKAPLAGAVWRLKNQGRVEIAREGATTIEDDDVLRLAGSSAVVVRELGPRTLEDVPLDEVAELMERLATAGATDLKRAVLDTYGLIRLTARADQYLEAALELASAPR